MQALAIRLQGGEDAIYGELLELSDRQLQHMANANGSDTTMWEGGVPLAAPGKELTVLEQQLKETMAQAGQRMKRLQVVAY